jgi:DNA mismatch repair protein MSH6
MKKVTIGEDVPDLSKSMKIILNNFQIIDTQDEKGNVVSKIIPKLGIFKEYDKNLQGFIEVKKRLDEILIKERKRLKCGIINYAHTKNIRYELEVPENVVINNRPKDYLLTTSKKGFLRFHTKEIIDNIKILEELEEQNKILTWKLNSEIFKIFYNQKNIISSFINIVAEIDCLTSLAFITLIDKDKFSRPKFITLEENNGIPYLELIQCIHPCLSDRVPYFVPNDIYLGKDNKTTIVITGPNMGGKSTILRQVCISAIIAQIGCFVPAKKCVMTLVDRIFTRIGANDKLLEGKSTFFIEMEETKNILENATKNSLIIMDELGRGTSTKDGQIIAKTVLYQIENKSKARCLFTTHYHDIIEWCKKEPNIRLSFMEAKIDEKNKDIQFKYKFIDGICPDSSGIEVAKLAGLPQKVINIACDVKEHNKLGIQ